MSRRPLLITTVTTLLLSIVPTRAKYLLVETKDKTEDLKDKTDEPKSISTTKPAEKGGRFMLFFYHGVFLAFFCPFFTLTQIKQPAQKIFLAPGVSGVGFLLYPEISTFIPR